MNTTLIAFFQLCQIDDCARTFMYANIPTYYTWNVTQKNFGRKKRDKVVVEQPGQFSSNALGRIYTVHSKQRRLYLFTFAFDYCSWSNIIYTLANNGWNST